MILHPSFVLPVMPDETPVGYASRLALRIGCSLRAFCNRIDVSLQELLDGVPRAVASLREVCQLAPDAFATTTFTRLPGRRFTISGEVLSIDQVNREALRICPACIEEQSAGESHENWSPKDWHIVSLHVCGIHSAPMTTIDVLRHQRQDFAGLLQAAKHQGLLTREDTATVVESGLGQHIRRRLRGVADDHMAASMPLYAAIKAAEMVGTAATYGAHHTWLTLSPVAKFETGRVGYDIMGEGEAGLRRLFAELQRKSHAKENSTAGLLASFGRLYLFLSNSTDVAYDPLKDVLRTHVLETMPFDRGEVVLGQKVTQRRVHSARTVAAEMGVSIPTALKRLQAIGVLDDDTKSTAWRKTTFDARKHAEAVRRLATALQRAEAGRYLGLKVVYEDVAPILDMVGSMNIDKTRLIDQVYAKEDLDAFLASFFSKASSASSSDHFEPIAKVSGRTHIAIAAILEMIRSGDITDVRLSPARKGIMSVMVRKRDVVAVVTARRTWLTLTEACKAYKMRDSTLSSLVRSGVIPSKGKSPLMLQPEDLDAFKRTYVTRHELTMKYQRLRSRANRYSVTKAIADAGLTPAFDEKQSRLVFFHREAVLTTLGPP